MRPLAVALALTLSAGCSGSNPGPPVNPTPCGTVGPMGAAVATFGCSAVSVSTQKADTTRVIVNSGTMDGEDLMIGAVTVNLKGLVHAVSYKTGDATILSSSGVVTRVSDGASWILAYDAADPGQAQGSLMLTVKMFQPDPSVSQELDLHGHLSASYASAAGQAALTLDIDY